MLFKILLRVVLFEMLQMHSINHIHCLYFAFFVSLMTLT